MDKFAEIGREYRSLLEFLKSAGTADPEGGLRAHFTACALRIWGSNELYSPDYRTLLRTAAGRDYSLEQIVTALGCCGEPERKLRTPDFFSDLVKSDARTGGHLAADFLDRYGQLLAAAAMVNGDFTLGEARMLTEITDGLARSARESGVSARFTRDLSGQVTERLEESYYRSGARSTPSEAPSLPAPVPEQTPEQPPEKTPRWPSAADEKPHLPPEPAPQAAPAPRPDNTPEGETLESLLQELDGLVGLSGVKRDVHSLMNFIKVARLRKARGMKVPAVSYHLVFTGNPGTGKTTVARLVARLYYQMGLLPRGQFVEADRSALVAGYLGQTAIKTRKVIDEAMGGVLFIDEAYALAGENEDSYGREAIETLLKAMEDHRDELVVIVAGYTELMHRFIGSNPGLSSRFSKYFEFPDYSGQELLEIFRGFCGKNGYSLEESAEIRLREAMERLFETRDEHFGNARAVRNIFEKAIAAQADRVAGLDLIRDQDLERILPEDVEAALGGGGK